MYVLKESHWQLTTYIHTYIHATYNITHYIHDVTTYNMLHVELRITQSVCCMYIIRGSVARLVAVYICHNSYILLETWLSCYRWDYVGMYPWTFWTGSRLGAYSHLCLFLFEVGCLSLSIGFLGLWPLRLTLLILRSGVIKTIVAIRIMMIRRQEG